MLRIKGQGWNSIQALGWLSYSNVLFRVRRRIKEEERRVFFLWVGWGAGVVLYCFVFLTFILFQKLPLVTRTPGIIIVNLGPKNAEFEIARRAIQKSCNTILGAMVLTPLEYRLTCTLYSFIYSLNQCLRTTY